MSQKSKQIDAIRNNPKQVRFDDACKVAVWLGFNKRSSSGTSHVSFARPGEPMQLNFQNRDGLIPPYQAHQLVLMIDKYEDSL